MSQALKALVKAAPKTETHLHIEGALPYRLLREWKPDVYPEKPYFYEPAFRFTTFPQFDEVLLGHALPWFTSPERYYEAAKVIFADHLAQGVRYVETSFHFPVAGFIGVPPDAITDALRAAVPAGLEVRLFAGMLRTDYDGPMRPHIDKLDRWDAIAGVDLHGFEQVPTQPWSAKIWERVRGAGKVTKVHAGEFDGPARVREAIEVLGSTRVQHGVRAIEDPRVVALARERGVTFDVCPISNVRLSVVKDIGSHPLPALLEAGVNCTVSTDDPLVFNNTVLDDYDALIDGLGFDARRVLQVLENGWKVALVSEQQRQEALAELRRLFSTGAF